MPKLMNLIGQTFNDLTVIERAPSQKKQTMWKCRCSCGNFTTVSSGNLRHNSVKSCGCKQFSVLSDKLTKNEVGKRFGRLIALEQVKIPKTKKGKKDGNQVYYRCICDCGRETVVWGGHLRAGNTVSCGCYRNDRIRETIATHGLSGTPEYETGRRHLRNALDKDWTLEMERVIRSEFPCCCICGITEEEHKQQFGQSLHVDHVLPLSAGNGLKPGNAVVLCRFHNDSKGDRSLNDLPLDWQASIIWNAFKFKDVWDYSR